MIVGTDCYSSSTGPQSFFEKYALEDIEVGNYVQLGQNVQFFSKPDHISIYNPKQVHNYPPQMIGADPVPYGNRGKLIIESDVWVGDNTVLFGGITIGEGAIIGAYSVVAKSIPPYAVAVGNPAKVRRYRFKKEVREALSKIQWFNWDREIIVKNKELFKDVDEFVKKYDMGSTLREKI